MKQKKILQLITPFVLTVVISACQSESQTDTDATEQTVVRPARVATAIPYVASQERVFPATIQAGNEADIAFRVSGQLIELPVVAGTRIVKGDILAKIDPTDLQNNLDGMVAQYDLIKTQYNQIQSLFKKKYSSQAEVDAVTAQLTAAEVAVRQARTNLGYTTIRAPFDAIVGRIDVENYQYIQPQQTIVELQATKQLDVLFDIPESLVKSMSNSAAYRELCGVVDFGSRAAGLADYTACYKQHDSVPDPTTRTYPVLFTLQGTQGATILPGMSADIKLDLSSLSSRKQEGALLPLESVFDQEDKQWVWVLDSELKVHKTEVEVAGISNGYIHVTSGIDSGTQVVSAGVSYLSENQQVRVFEKERGL